MGRKRFWIYLGFITFLGIVVAGYLYWTTNNHPAMPEALESLVSDSEVQVQVDSWLVFTPVGRMPSTGLIFYPGGLVEPSAYAPAGQAIARAGYLVVIPVMPLNLAVFGVNRAADIMAAYPEISNWVIGGHSLGGSMAANYADQNPDDISGLILWASFLADSNDLSDQDIKVASIYGTLDGLATPEEILASRTRLPENTFWVPIEGGNHAQFGWYGPQDGDHPATIDRVDQQSQVVAGSLALLAQVEE